MPNDPLTSPAITPADRHRAKELCAKATSGPWDIYKQPVNSTDHAIHELAQQVKDTAPFVGTLFLLSAMVDEHWLCPATSGCGPTSEANADFIAFSRTAIPAYESRVVELEANVAMLTEQRAVISDKYKEWMERALSAEGAHRIACDDASQAEERAEAAEARATAAEAALRQCADWFNREHPNASGAHVVRAVLADRPQEGTQE